MEYAYGIFALIDATAFASFVEAPARAAIKDQGGALEQWQAGIDKAALIQIAFVVGSVGFSIAEYQITKDVRVAVASALMLLNFPYTFLSFGSTNAALMKAHPSDQDIHDLLGVWNKKHTVRTFFGIGATVLLTLSLMSKSQPR